MAVELLKLVSGEEIIASVEENGDNLNINKPVKLLAGQAGFGCGPFLLGVSDDVADFVINKNHVMVRGEAIKELANFYNERYGSGIILA